ncbi:MAG: hypothetical protein IPJ69_03175 [Deltaproteobacteria bacterium]|nr:MAG: hypothetical protein IPJ69_03175 [Deltaproteobacteria bacterium]
MPIHHFKRDLAYLEKNNPSILKSSGNEPYNYFLKSYAKFYQKSHEAIFSEKEIFQTENPYAVGDALWIEKISTLIETSKKLFGITLEPFSGIDMSTYPVKEKLPPAGFLYFRQKIFPSSESFYTCKDLTEYISSQKKRIIWTETFQGSTICSFSELNYERNIS